MYKNSKFTILLPLIVAVCLAAGAVLGMFLVPRTAVPGSSVPERALGAGGAKLTKVMQLINTLYVDPVSTDSITEQVIPMLLEELDPHSVYIPVDNMAQANEALDGEFDGIGVMFNMATDTVIVLNVISGGPSARAGVLNGDRIITIDDSLVAGVRFGHDNVMKHLRGPRGTEVKLGLERRGVRELVPITVTRGVIPIKSIDAAFMLAPGVGYLKLTAFSRNSHKEISEALAALRGEGMRRLIFDLRGNTGGFLDQAILIANEFLPADKLIVYTEDRFRKRAVEYSDGTGRYQDLELDILIDEGSASSSEILAGAIQDNDRGTIIGRRSFGKGLVQQQFPFSDGSAMRLTIARYYTPTGRCIQKPYVPGDEEGYRSDIANRMRHSELFSADSIRFDDSLRYETPGGRVVYGGGGIMPDVFVPADTSDVTPYFLEVTGRNILYQYTIDYADRHRDALNAVQTLPELQALLDADTRLLDDFVAYAARRGVAPRASQIDRSRNLLTAQLRAYIGRNTKLDDVGFYANIYTIDNVMLRALETPGLPSLDTTGHGHEEE